MVAVAAVKCENKTPQAGIRIGVLGFLNLVWLGLGAAKFNCRAPRVKKKTASFVS